MTKPLKFLIGIPAIIIAVLFLLSRFDFTDILFQISQLGIFSFLSAFILIWISMMISTARFGLINKNFGISSSWAFFHKVNMLSTLYSIFAMPMIMQIAGRIQFGTRTARTLYGPITVFEKSVSFGLMLIIAAFSSYAFFENTFFDYDFLYALAVISISVCFVTLVSIAVFFTDKDREKLVLTLQLIRRIGVSQNLALSVLLQFFILSSYVLLAVQLLPDTHVLLLYGAFSIVVLATAIPIGFGGYGVREATAGAVFLSFGLPAEVGVAAGLIYSITHLLVLGINIFISLSARDNNAQNAIESDGLNNAGQINYAPLWLITAVLAVIFMCFQIRIPILNGTLTLNPADIIALIVAINALILAYIGNKIFQFWSNNMMWTGIFCFACMIAIAWFIGWINFGSNEWAFTNRLLGLISVLSFLLLGACLRQYLSQTEQQMIFKIMMFTFITTSIVQICISTHLPQSVFVFFNWKGMLSGFVGDRNAFSFLGLILIALVASTFTRDQHAFPMQKIIFIFIGIILATVVISGSRTGWVGTVILAASLFLFSRKGFLYAGASFAILISTFLLLQDFNSSEYKITFASNRGFEDLQKLSNLRYLTWITGLNFFIDNPFFGAGLGASIEKIDIVIHNLYLWVAGEMGLVGILLCLPISYAVLKQAFPGLLKNPSIYQISLLLFLLVFGAFSLTHDIIYQRILWFGIGYFMANEKFLRC
jgi:uncharacterized membrane protein YbhN (UPF0104 family)